jgi:hypothetical protein
MLAWLRLERPFVVSAFSKENERMLAELKRYVEIRRRKRTDAT